MSRPVYRWRVVPPHQYGIDAVEVIGASRYEAIIAAAKLWRTPWTPIARACTFEKLGEWTEPENCNKCEYISITEEEQHKEKKGTPHVCKRFQKRVFHDSRRPGFHGMIHPCKECIEEREARK